MRKGNEATKVDEDYLGFSLELALPSGLKSQAMKRH